MTSDFPELFKDAFSKAADQIFNENRPNGGYENPYIVFISWDVYKEIKNKLDKNLMYHNELTGCWHKVFILADR